MKIYFLLPLFLLSNSCALFKSVPATEATQLKDCGEAALMSQSSLLESDAIGLISNPSKNTIVADLETLAIKAGPPAAGCAVKVVIEDEKAKILAAGTDGGVPMTKALADAQKILKYEQELGAFLAKHGIVLTHSHPDAG